MTENSRYRIVLESVPEAQEADVAHGLVAMFGLAQVMAGKIVKAAPITVLDKLQHEQAMRLGKEFTPLTLKGAKVQIERVGARKLAAISWPVAPKIHGQPLETFLPEKEPAAGGPRQGTTVNVFCPHCGKPLTVNVTVGLCSRNADERAAQAAPAKAAKNGASSGKTKSSESEENLIEGLSPFSPLAQPNVGPKLEEFETGLIDLYNMEDEEEKL